MSEPVVPVWVPIITWKSPTTDGDYPRGPWAVPSLEHSPHPGLREDQKGRTPTSGL